MAWMTTWLSSTCAWAVFKRVSLDAMPIMLKRLTFTGSTLRARSGQQKADLVALMQSKVWPLLEQGSCLPVIHSVFPMDEVGQAHALMESSQHIGKIMLAIAER
ncbi:MAG: zinc-binding dehydrogenase [Burkholderiaceae bacterium]|nr:zinc-binding dehydrogenase [Burkholderiaceae bacterium]